MSYKHFSFVLLGIALGAFTMGALQFTLAWTPPAGAPPTPNVDAPINVSATGQTKTGIIGSLIAVTAPWFCIGLDCIDAWPINKNGNYQLASNINMGGKQITNLGGTVNPTDTATKAYVDSKVVGGGGITSITGGVCPAGQVVQSISATGAATCVTDVTGGGANCTGGSPVYPFYVPVLVHGQSYMSTYSAGGNVFNGGFQCWNGTIIQISYGTIGP